MEEGTIEVACATSLAGVLIFLTIERKFDIKQIFDNITNLDKDIDNEKKRQKSIDENFSQRIRDARSQSYAEERIKALQDEHEKARIESSARITIMALKSGIEYDDALQEQEYFSSPKTWMD